MAKEKPEVWFYVELGPNHSFAVLAAFLADFGDAVEHQHRRQRQLRVAGAEQFPAAARQQVFVFEAVPARVHKRCVPRQGAWLNSHAQVGNTPKLAGKDGDPTGSSMKNRDKSAFPSVARRLHL